MTKRSDIAVGSVLKVLNDSSLLEDPINSRVGSFFYGPNQELRFDKYMPKGEVTLDNTSTDEKSFGNAFKRNKTDNVLVNFYTRQNATSQAASTSGLKEDELIYAYMDLIEQSLIDNQDTLNFNIVGIGDFNGVNRFGEQNILVGTKVFSIRYRK